MPIVPLKQHITLYKSGESDGWGGNTESEPVLLKARVDNEVNVVKNQNGEEAVTELKILLEKSIDIGYDDELYYKDEVGNEVKRKPTNIDTKRHINGNPILKVVYL